jgi:hypothetical protein
VQLVRAILIFATGTDVTNAILPCGHGVLVFLSTKENEKEIAGVTFKSFYLNVTCILIARQQVGRHIPATHMHAIIEGHPLLGNGGVNTVFSVGSVQSVYKKFSAGQ